MKIRAASGRVYNWDKPTAPSAEDIDALVEYDKALETVGPEGRSTTKPTSMAGEVARPEIDPARTTSTTQPASKADKPEGDVRDLVNAVEDMGIRAAGPAVGQWAGAMTGPFAPAAVPVFGAIGGVGSEYVANRREGIPNTAGKLISAGISGSIPGASLAKAGAGTIAKEAGKYALGAAAGETAESLIDRGELPEAQRVLISGTTAALGAPAGKAFSAEKAVSAERELYAMRDKAFRDLREEGVKIPPHEVGEGSNILSSVGGKAALQQQAAKENQYTWQRLARDEIGLDAKAKPISLDELKAKRAEFAEPYQKLEEMSDAAKDKLAEMQRSFNSSEDRHAMEIAMNDPATKAAMDPLLIQAGADVKLLKDVRLKAQAARDSMKMNPNGYEEWQKYKGMAEHLEDTIEQAAQTVGDDTLLNRLRESRKKIAQTYAIEDSLNPSTGLIDPIELGRKVDRGEPLSGNLKKIGNFALAFNREAIEATRVPTPGVGNLGAMASVSDASRGNAAGVIGGVVNATMGKPTRAFLLSKLSQQALLRPDKDPTMIQNLLRYFAQNADEAINSEGSQSSPQPGPGR